MSMTMNRIKTTLAALMAALVWLGATAADYKVLESSAKKTPEWLYQLPQGTILVELERPDLGTAQGDAELELKRRIINAVATNITNSTDYRADETWADDTHRMLEQFSTETSTRAATLPFLKGISLARAQGTYWEKREDKKTKRTYVVFSACYPLSDRELAEMTAEFERNDRAKTDELAALRAGVGSVDSNAAIQDALGRLTALEAYFFDNVRLAETKAVEKQYKELYRGLTLSGAFYGGSLVCEVKLNGKPFKVTANPTLKSDCASGLRAEPDDDGTSFTVYYNAEDCLPDEQNWIEVSLRVGSAPLRGKFRIPL